MFQLFKDFFFAYHLKYQMVNFLCYFSPKFLSGSIRAAIYRIAGFKIGRASYIMGNIELLGSSRDFYQNLELGTSGLISTNVTINLDDRVVIGDNVTLSPFVRIYTSTHLVGTAEKRCAPWPVNKPVYIEDGCWIALGATLLPGVRIGRGSVVAAGAVVTHDIPPNSFAAGVPAKVVKSLPE